MPLSLGDILNWAAGGIVFPLMMLPLAALIEGRRPGILPTISTGATVWIILVLGTALAGMEFVRAVPRLDLSESAKGGMFAFVGLVALQTLAIASFGGAAESTRTLARVFRFIAKTAGRIVMWLALAMGLLQFVVVILRYVFGVNFISMQESLTYMHGAVFLIAAGYALLTDDHVRVDIFYRGLSDRGKALVDFIGAYLFLFPVVLVILWTASPYVGESWSVREGSAEQSGIQGVYLLKALIPTFAILVAMAGFAMAAQAGETLRRKR